MFSRLPITFFWILLIKESQLANSDL